METTLLSLSCNHCGAPLEVREGTRFLTCSYCSSRLQVEQGGGAWYTSVLEQIQKNTAVVASDLLTVKLQLELERIEREWMQERESYLVRGKNGEIGEPNAAVSGAVFGVFAALVVPIMFAAKLGGVGILLGLPFVGLALFVLCSRQQNASRYETAQAAYMARRENVLRKMKKP